MFNRWRFARRGAVLLLISLTAGAATQAPLPTSAPAAARVPVAIEELRTSAAGLDARAATDLFVTALVNAGGYRIVDDGTGHGRPAHGARYILAGLVTRSGSEEKSARRGFSIGGLNIGRGKNKETLGIDVRVLDAVSGEVVDSISVRRPLNGSSSSVSGVGTAAAGVLASHGKSVPYVPDVSHESATQDSLDDALRALMEAAVAKLGERGLLK